MAKVVPKSKLPLDIQEQLNYWYDYVPYETLPVDETRAMLLITGSIVLAAVLAVYFSPPVTKESPSQTQEDSSLPRSGILW